MVEFYSVQKKDVLVNFLNTEQVRFVPDSTYVVTMLFLKLGVSPISSTSHNVG